MTENAKSEWFVWALPLLWRSRRRLLIVAGAGCLLFCLVAFSFFPRQYQSVVRLMPPDAQSAMGFASMASALSGVPPSVTGGGLASLVNSRSPSAIFLAILASRTAQDDIINRFDLRKVYGCRTYGCARKTLSKRTSVDEDKKTGVVTVAVRDNDPARARELAGAYVDELNKLVVVMDTSSAHRERVFLEQQLQTVKQNLDSASVQLSHFSSSHATMDVQRQGSAMLDAATKLQGELIGAQSELSELQAAYSPENYRSVRLNEAVYETLTKQYALAKVEEARGIPTVTVLDAPDLPEKRMFPVWLVMVVAGTVLSLIGGAAWIVGPELWRQLDSADSRKAALREMLAGFREGEPPSAAQRSAV